MDLQERTGILSIYAIPRQLQLRWSDHLVRIDDERLPKRLFYRDVKTGSHRQGGQVRRYENTLKTSLKRQQINPANWEDHPRDRPTWRRTVKTGVAIFQTNRITAAASQRQRPTVPNVSTMSADIPEANWTFWTPPDQLQHPDCTNRRLSVHLSHVVN
ncbi:hypothetical protein SprV_0200985600 [Sparganum proliferum]